MLLFDPGVPKKACQIHVSYDATASRTMVGFFLYPEIHNERYDQVADEDHQQLVHASSESHKCVLWPCKNSSNTLVKWSLPCDNTHPMSQQSNRMPAYEKN
ncbi:hypothetical protein LINPERPRIM_LOCUS29752 [Linum perenne]